MRLFNPLLGASRSRDWAKPKALFPCAFSSKAGCGLGITPPLRHDRGGGGLAEWLAGARVGSRSLSQFQQIATLHAHQASTQPASTVSISERSHIRRRRPLQDPAFSRGSEARREGFCPTLLRAARPARGRRTVRADGSYNTPPRMRRWVRLVVAILGVLFASGVLLAWDFGWVWGLVVALGLSLIWGAVLLALDLKDSRGLRASASSLSLIVTAVVALATLIPTQLDRQRLEELVTEDLEMHAFAGFAPISQVISPLTEKTLGGKAVIVESVPTLSPSVFGPPGISTTTFVLELPYHLSDLLIDRNRLDQELQTKLGVDEFFNWYERHLNDIAKQSLYPRNPLVTYVVLSNKSPRRSTAGFLTFAAELDRELPIIGVFTQRALRCSCQGNKPTTAFRLTCERPLGPKEETFVRLEFDPTLLEILRSVGPELLSRRIPLIRSVDSLDGGGWKIQTNVPVSVRMTEARRLEITLEKIRAIELVKPSILGADAFENATLFTERDTTVLMGSRAASDPDVGKVYWARCL